jgi:hypothetical protein
VLAQPVDATPSNALIRQCFLGRTDLFDTLGENLARDSVPADLIRQAFLAFVFNARWVLAECCGDLLKPPGLPCKWFLADFKFPVSAFTTHRAAKGAPSLTEYGNK